MSLQVLEPPSKEVMEKVRSEFGLNEQRVREAVEHLKNWIELQPHLPKEIDDGRLERWLIRCKNSIEKVKKTLDKYYTLRTNIPDVMTGWDTKSDWFEHTSNYACLCPMPQLTPDFERIFILGPRTTDSSKFNFIDVIKWTLMVMEIRISEDYSTSDIHVYDFSKLTLGYVVKCTPSNMKKYELCFLSGYNSRIKALHFLNASPHAELLINMMKSVFTPKLAERIQVHGSNWERFYEQVPKDLLPTEYGGKAGPIAEICDLWKKKLESYHDIYLERENYKSDESKRPGHPISSSEFLGFEGSFRKLDVD